MKVIFKMMSGRMRWLMMRWRIGREKMELSDGKGEERG